MPKADSLELLFDLNAIMAAVADLKKRRLSADRPAGQLAPRFVRVFALLELSLAQERAIEFVFVSQVAAFAVISLETNSVEYATCLDLNLSF